MKNSNRSCMSVRAGASHLVLGLACASLASACSGYYPLGETSEAEQFLDDGSNAPGETAQATASLPPPDVTIDGVDSLGLESLASVGDLDGDGRDEMAVGAFDLTTEVAYVHLRYGGPRPRDGQEAFAFDESGVRLTMPNGRLPILRPLTMFGAGDVDGDGYGDLMITTVDCDTTQADEGVYLVYGGPARLEGTLPLPSVATRFVPPARVAEPPAQAASCRMPLAASPGDIDGDGFDDVVLPRAPQDDMTNTLTPDTSAIFGTGEGLYVFYGRAQRFSGDVPYATADASFHMEARVDALPLGDMNGDGLTDLLMQPNFWPVLGPGSFLVEGRAERWSGALDIGANATLLEGAYAVSKVMSHGDLDGDGLDEVLLRNVKAGPFGEPNYLDLHVFYGAPELFANGLDFAEAEATISSEAVRHIYPVGDRDGDGDDELLDQFSTGDAFSGLLSSNIAFSSGSSERLSGAVIFPESEVTAQAPGGRFPESLSPDGRGGRALEHAIPAGDLDGDGAEDLLTTSFIYGVVDDGSFALSDPQLHIHYGTPAPQTTLLR